MRDKMTVSGLGLTVSLLLLLQVQVARGACPNKCAGHGQCGKNDVCVCMQNWTGGDCSLRVCPYTRAWHDTAVAKDDAHYYQECANRGTCDRDKGVCVCDAGFAGSGCRRLACPLDCSGHGTCEFIEDLAGNGYDPRIGGAFGRKYTLWDQEKIMGCRCDPLFEGHDCASRVCPKGDDPLTRSQTEMVQDIIVSGASGLIVQGYLTYHDPYGMAWTTDRITFDSTSATTAAASCAAVQVALQRLPNNVLNKVTVTSVASPVPIQPFVRDSPTSDTGTAWETQAVGVAFTSALTGSPISGPITPRLICQVSFTSEPGSTGYQNLLRCNVAPHADSQGQRPMTTGDTTSSCIVIEDYSSTTAPTTVSTKATGLTRALSELAECSNRGQCDAATGNCKCYAGHMGLACQKQEALV